MKSNSQSQLHYVNIPYQPAACPWWVDFAVEQVSFQITCVDEQAEILKKYRYLLRKISYFHLGKSNFEYLIWMDKLLSFLKLFTDGLQPMSS